MVVFASAGLPALRNSESGQVRKEAAITINRECRGKARHFHLSCWRCLPPIRSFARLRRQEAVNCIIGDPQATQQRLAINVHESFDCREVVRQCGIGPVVG